MKKLAKGWGDVLSLHLQTGLRAAFHSVFHALLRHCIPYISPTHFHSLPEILVKRDAKTTFLCPDSWQRMPQYLSHFARSGSVYPCDMHCRFGLFAFQSPSNQSPKLPLLHCKTATFTLQNCHFWDAKRTILECKTHRFGMQNAPLCIAKSA